MIRIQVVADYSHPSHPCPFFLFPITATLPNVEDLGVWLECPPSAVFNFDYTYRPVPLDVHVLGYPNASNPFLFNKSLETKVL